MGQPYYLQNLPAWASVYCGLLNSGVLLTVGFSVPSVLPDLQLRPPSVHCHFARWGAIRDTRGREDGRRQVLVAARVACLSPDQAAG